VIRYFLSLKWKIYYPKKTEITELGTFINKLKILELKRIQIPRPIRFSKPKKIEENNIDNYQIK